MDDGACMEVAHGLGYLLGDIDDLLKGERLRPDMDTLVKIRTFTITV